MNRRMFVFLAVLFCTLGVLLLLSALLVTPGTQEALPEQPPVAHSITAFFSMPPTAPSVDAVAFSAWLRVAALFAVLVLMVPRLLCACDANGRVLRRKRYVRSYHQVFRPELACG